MLAVRGVCLKQLQDSITAENVLECFEMADACTAKDLMQACTEFITQPGNSYYLACSLVRACAFERTDVYQHPLHSVYPHNTLSKRPLASVCFMGNRRGQAQYMQWQRVCAEVTMIVMLHGVMRVKKD